MINDNTNFFEIIDNFKKIKHIESISIVKSRLNFLPKITIAIPTYNRPHLLKEAIDSAINQLDFEEYDIIVLDNNPERDCETETLLKSYSNPKISYFKNSQNIGMVGNWNRCFEISSGKWVVLLHDDDLLLPSFLCDTFKILEKKKDIGILKPLNFKIQHPISSGTFKKIPKKNNELKQLYDISFYYGQTIGVPSGIIYKKEPILAIGGFNDEYYPTADFCLMVLFSKHYKVFTLNEYLSIYRIGQNESMNIKTLTGFLTNDYYLLKQLITENFPIKFITMGFLRHRTNNMAKALKRIWNKKFNFNMNLLNLKPINPLLGKFYHIIIRMYFRMCILIRKI